MTSGVGFLVLAPCNRPESTTPQTTCNIGGAAIVLGGLATLLGTITEIQTTPAVVDDYNRAHASLTLAPIRAHDGSIAPGVALTGRF